MYCLSSIYRTEAFAIVQVEAMSCGKPIVATVIEGSGVSWVNKTGYSGLNVKPCNSRELAGAIKRVCEDPYAYSQYSAQARLRFESCFEKEKMINECMNLYGKLEKKEKEEYQISMEKKYQTSF